jgi:rhodanese-related sulfurtransferase
LPENLDMESHPKTWERGARAVLREGLLVAGGAIAFALVANALSPRGLALGRNYFPGSATPPAAVPLSSTNRPGLATVTNLAARLAARGLRAVTQSEAVELFRDVRYAQGLVVFLDARDEAHYQAGHIPGAYLFDHYRAPTYLPTVLPVCLTAETVLVYCNGGDCEDSEFAAITLRDTGAPAGKLGVLVGGFQQWETNSLPVELGARNSGNLREVRK